MHIRFCLKQLAVLVSRIQCLKDFHSFLINLFFFFILTYTPCIKFFTVFFKTFDHSFIIFRSVFFKSKWNPSYESGGLNMVCVRAKIYMILIRNLLYIKTNMMRPQYQLSIQRKLLDCPNDIITRHMTS